MDTFILGLERCISVPAVTSVGSCLFVILEACRNNWRKLPPSVPVYPKHAAETEIHVEPEFLPGHALV